MAIIGYLRRAYGFGQPSATNAMAGQGREMADLSATFEQHQNSQFPTNLGYHHQKPFYQPSPPYTGQGYEQGSRLVDSGSGGKEPVHDDLADSNSLFMSGHDYLQHNHRQQYQGQYDHHHHHHRQPHQTKKGGMYIGHGLQEHKEYHQQQHRHQQYYHENHDNHQYHNNHDNHHYNYHKHHHNGQHHQNDQHPEQHHEQHHKRQQQYQSGKQSSHEEDKEG